MTLSEAAEFATRWAENQRGIAALAEALQTLGSIEQAITERRKALAEATAAHEAKKAEVAAAEAELVTLKDQHANASTVHSINLAEEIAKTQQRAAQIITEAEARSEQMLVEARKQIEQERNTHAQTMASLAAELNEARSDLAAVRSAHADAVVQHGDLAAKIESMKTAARGILG